MTQSEFHDIVNEIYESWLAQKCMLKNDKESECDIELKITKEDFNVILQTKKERGEY